MDLTQELFTEKLRPKTLSGMLLPPRVRAELEKGLIQNIILYGPAGCGKTSISRILTSGMDVLRINGSSENGIDIIREKVVNHASTLSIMNSDEVMKVIYIDEADGLTSNAWDALRETIEHYADNARFICTCNRIDKIPEPIQSRFNCIPVYPINNAESEELMEGYCKYIGNILSYLKISYEDDVLHEFVKQSFPDMRSIINSIQSLYLQKVTSLDRNQIIKRFECEAVFKLICEGGDPVENYKFLSANYKNAADDVLAEISSNFIEFLLVNYPDKSDKLPYLTITIAEYIAQLPVSIDHFIVLLACCYKLQLIIVSKQ